MAKDNPNIREAKIIETEKICLNSYFSLEVKLCTQITHLKELNREGTVHRLLDSGAYVVFIAVLFGLFLNPIIYLYYISLRKDFIPMKCMTLRSGINTKIKKTVYVC